MNPEAKAFIRIKKADNYMKRKTNPYIFFIPIYYILQRTAHLQNQRQQRTTVNESLPTTHFRLDWSFSNSYVPWKRTGERERRRKDLLVRSADPFPLAPSSMKENGRKRDLIKVSQWLS
jgi:hypothetical protein